MFVQQTQVEWCNMRIVVHDQHKHRIIDERRRDRRVAAGDSVVAKDVPARLGRARLPAIDVLQLGVRRVEL